MIGIFQFSQTDAYDLIAMDSCRVGYNPCSTVCVLDPEVGGGTAYFPPPIDTESWEKAVTAT